MVTYAYITDSMEENIDYNSIPVYYCEHCLSLKVKCDAPIDYCDKCSSTDISHCSIDEYDRIYEKRFGEKYFNK